MKSAILVLGMGRSGSSALTRVLSLCGASLPVTLLPPNRGNPLGYWEPNHVVSMNDQFLMHLKSSWYDATLRAQRLVEARTYPADWVGKVIDCVVAEYGEAQRIVLKEPRVSALLPLWIEALRRADYAITAVVVFRSPDSVAASLGLKDGLTRFHSRALWLKYNLLAERGTRGLHRCFVECDALIADWRPTVARIADELAIPLDAMSRASAIDAFLSRDLLHHHHGQTIEPPDPGGWLCAVHEVLQRAAARRIVETAALDDCYAQFAACSQMFDTYAGSGPALSA